MRASQLKCPCHPAHPAAVDLTAHTLCCVAVCTCSEKNEVVADGTLLDSETISVHTPNYEMYGALAVDVRVSINGEGWTVNKIKFKWVCMQCVIQGRMPSTQAVRFPTVITLAWAAPC
jgi:hypothetical protein